jgi:hypothetical protein
MRIAAASDVTENQIVNGLITSTNYTKIILPDLEYKLFNSEDCRLVAKWAINYYMKYKESPGVMIKDIFIQKAPQLKMPQRKRIDAFLTKISEDHEKGASFNDEYIITKTKRYIFKQKLEINLLQMQDCLEEDDVEGAEEIWKKDIKNTGDAQDLGVNPLDPKYVKEVFAEDKSRIQVGTGIEALDILGGKVKSGWLACFMGAMKKGKTFTLLHVALNAVMKGEKVVVVSFETEEEDNSKRMWKNIGSYADGNETVLLFPYYDELNNIQYRKRRRPPFTPGRVIRALGKFTRMYGGDIRIKQFPMNGATVQDIESYMDALEIYEDFVTTVLVVDYLGLIGAPPGITGRDIYDINSKGLKSIGQKRKIPVFMGHQGNRKSLDIQSIRSSDTPENILILANVDIMYTINQEETEKEKQIIRYAVVAHRHRNFSTIQQAQVLQQLKAGQVVLDSTVIRVKSGDTLKTKTPSKQRNRGGSSGKSVGR